MKGRILKKYNRAMTLVEIMVVVAIIAILVTIALPNFKRAAQMANKSICVNNLKLLKNAVELYLYDYPGVNENSLIVVTELVGPDKKYIKDPETKIRCPEGRGQVSYPSFYINGDPVCSFGPTTTDPAGDGTFPEHKMP